LPTTDEERKWALERYLLQGIILLGSFKENVAAELLMYFHPGIPGIH